MTMPSATRRLVPSMAGVRATPRVGDPVPIGTRSCEMAIVLPSEGSFVPSPSSSLFTTTACRALGPAHLDHWSLGWDKLTRVLRAATPAVRDSVVPPRAGALTQDFDMRGGYQLAAARVELRW